MYSCPVVGLPYCHKQTEPNRLKQPEIMFHLQRADFFSCDKDLTLRIHLMETHSAVQTTRCSV